MPSFWSVLLGVASLVLGENLDENLQQVNTSFDQLLNQGVLSPSLTSAAASVNGNFNELSAVLASKTPWVVRRSKNSKSSK